LEKVRVAVIGVGGHGRHRHLAPLARLQQVEVVAVADINKARADSVASEYRVRSYTDYREMLERERPDAVSIATPTGLHARVALDAIRSGAHVLVDKPLGTSLGEVVEVVSEAKRLKRVLMVGYWSRFSPALGYAVELREEGALGDIYVAYAYLVRRRGIPGSPTFVDRGLAGGGALLDIGCYAIDNALAIMGFPKPVSVSGAVYTKFGRNPEEVRFNWGSWDPSKFDLEDYAVGLVKFENGATMLLEVGWAANVSHAGEELRLRVLGDKGGIEAVGHEAIVDISFHSRTKRYLYDAKPVMRRASPEDMAYEMARSFIEAVLRGGDPPVTGYQSLLVHAIIDGIYESARRGEEVRVKIPEV